MTRHQRARYESLVRVREFGKAHCELFPPSSTGGRAFANVATAAAEIEAHATAKILTAKDGREATQVARNILIDRMKIVARTGKGLRKASGAAAR